MNTVFVFVLYLIVVVTPLAIGTIYAIYLFCTSQIKLYLLERKIKQKKLDIYILLDLHLSKKQCNEKDFKTLQEIKREIEEL